MFVGNKLLLELSLKHNNFFFKKIIFFFVERKKNSTGLFLDK